MIEPLTLSVVVFGIGVAGVTVKRAISAAVAVSERWAKLAETPPPAPACAHRWEVLDKRRGTLRNTLNEVKSSWQIYDMRCTVCGDISFRDNKADAQ